jgi:hypothetical protein
MSSDYHECSASSNPSSPDQSAASMSRAPRAGETTGQRRIRLLRTMLGDLHEEPEE